ncbi:MAG: hypothetical protein AAF543_01540 [Pseudomonadota bacterium]
MMWAELLFFVALLGLAVHQLYSVKKAQRERIERERAEASATGDDREKPPDG